MNEITQDIDKQCIIETFGNTDLIATAGKLKSGYTPVQYDAIVAIETAKITDVLSQVTASALTGADGENSDDGTFYIEITESGSDNLLEVFKDSGRAAPDLVANGTDTSKAGGAVTLTAQNTSGLGGTITLIASAVADAAASIEYIEEIDRYDDAVASQIVKGIAKEYNSDNDYIEVYPKCNALLASVGKDGVNDRFEKNTMIALFRDAGIHLT